MNSRHRLSGALVLLTLFLTIVLVAPQTGGAASPDQQMLESIDSYVDQEMDASRIPGAVLTIVHDDTVEHSRGFGTTAGDEQPVTPDTLFGIGSTAKSMTALAVMQLSEAGAIDLDAPIQQYIQWFRLADEEQSSHLTVRHLLTMTSGIAPAAGGEAFRSTEPMTPEAAIRSLRTAEFAYEPGKRFEYVNANFVILGHLIEVVSGQSYGDFMQEHIFTPLEMGDTYTDLNSAMDAGFAGGHRYWFGVPVQHTMDPLPALVPAGYITSTAADLGNYLQMYLNEGTFNGRSILSADGIAEMRRGVTDATLGPWAGGASAQYAMGWYVGGPWEGGNVVFHPGSEPAGTAMLMIDHDQQTGVVMLMNAATEMPLPGAAGALRVLPAGVMDILTGNEPGTTGLGRFYIIFNLVVAAIVALQLVALVRLVIRGTRDPEMSSIASSPSRRVRRIAPLTWEFGAPLFLTLLPLILGMSWRSLMLWTPDLGLVAIVIGSLWLITGVIRTGLLVRGRSRREQSHRQSDSLGEGTRAPAWVDSRTTP